MGVKPANSIPYSTKPWEQHNNLKNFQNNSWGYQNLHLASAWSVYKSHLSEHYRIYVGITITSALVILHTLSKLKTPAKDIKHQRGVMPHWKFQWTSKTVGIGLYLYMYTLLWDFPCHAWMVYSFMCSEVQLETKYKPKEIYGHTEFIHW